MTCFMDILPCSDNRYYSGSTKDLDKRLEDHQLGLGSNHPRKYGPVELIYFEEFDRIAFAFYREKQIQGWSGNKKKALIENRKNDLKMLSECRNKTHFSLSKLGKKGD